MTKKAEELYQALSYPFKEDAIQLVKMGKRQFHSIKAQYVIERLNKVLGIDGWSLSGDYQAGEKGVLFVGNLEIKALSHTVQAVGFAQYRFDNVGDAYKSAKTDALSKAASWIGVGNDVFKGKGHIPMYDLVQEHERENPKPRISDEQIKSLKARVSKLPEDLQSKFEGVLFKHFGIPDMEEMGLLTEKDLMAINKMLDKKEQENGG